MLQNKPTQRRLRPFMSFRKAGGKNSEFASSFLGRRNGARHAVSGSLLSRKGFRSFLGGPGTASFGETSPRYLAAKSLPCSPGPSTFSPWVEVVLVTAAHFRLLEALDVARPRGEWAVIGDGFGFYRCSPAGTVALRPRLRAIGKGSHALLEPSGPPSY